MPIFHICMTSPHTSLGSYQMRSQCMQRIRPLRTMLCQRSLERFTSTGHPSLPSHRTKLHSHIWARLGCRWRTSSTWGLWNIWFGFMGRYCRPHRWFPPQGWSSRSLSQSLRGLTLLSITETMPSRRYGAGTGNLPWSISSTEKEEDWRAKRGTKECAAYAAQD